MTPQILNRDDNVHIENSLLFAAELFRNNILFRQHSYPDVIILCTRGLYYKNHIYQKLVNFWK